MTTHCPAPSPCATGSGPNVVRSLTVDPSWFVIERPVDSPPRAVHQHLPTSGWAVYVLVADGVVLYVGSTMRPRERMKEHAKNYVRRWQTVTHVLARLMPSELDARSLEEELHAELRPRESRVLASERARRRQLLAVAGAL
jgi:predicted GIY-YIG superfamily endonuclease